jgi:hypothetical protein
MKIRKKIGNIIVIIVTIALTLFIGNKFKKVYAEKKESVHPQNRSD